MVMRADFQNELKNLHKDLLKMGTVIEKTIDLMIEGLKTRDEKILEDVIERDAIVDNYEYNIERSCLNLILKQQPVASDLRTIASILKIITDLERIADQSSDISEYVLKIIKNNKAMSSDITAELPKSKYDIPEIINMALEVKRMLSTTIDCYVKLDADLAVKTSLSDDIIDNYFTGITDKIAKVMKEDNNNIYEGICLLHIIKYLERMGDHSTNICEWIAYRVTGEHNQYN